MQCVQRRADELARDGHFLGGPPEQFEAVGRHQLITLLEQGLAPRHTLLDVGCGCLRGGYWCIHFLDKGRYFGIEPNQEMLELGKREIVGDEVMRSKSPRFSHRDDFDFSEFGVRFDYVIARSIWSHAAPAQIETMLDQFVATGNEDGIFLTSYYRANLLQRQYSGTHWVGRSHISDTPGIVRYRLDWIADRCAERGLVVRELSHNILDQVWLRICRKHVDARLESQAVRGRRPAGRARRMLVRAMGASRR